MMRTHPARFTLAVLIAVSPASARAQSPDWNAFLAVRPDPSAYIADWETDPSVVTLVLSYTGSAGVTFHLTGAIRRGATLILAGRSTTFEFVRPSQLLLTTRDGIWEPNSVTYDPALSDQLERTGRIPDGEYQFCVEVREGLSETPGVLLTQSCADFSVTAPAPPSLVAPGDGDTVLVPLPTFAWTPVTAGLNAGVTYHLRIAEVLPNQSPLDAINNNAPQLTADLPISLYQYSQAELPLRDSALYVWQVQALDAAGQPFGERQGKSEVWTFTMGGWLGVRQPIAGRLPDTLTLIPGVARLRGLRGVDGAESASAYTLNGMVVLDLLAPVVGQATVALEDLSIEKASLLALIDGGIPDDQPPDFLSGHIQGRLDTLMGPDTGPSFLRFREVEFTPGAGLAFGGELLVPGRPSVPFEGRVRFADRALAGTLTAAAPAGASLFSVGGDPVRLDVRGAELTLPAGELRLTGALALFGRDVGCDAVTARVDIAGNGSATLTCVPGTPIAFAPGVDQLRMALTGVSGSLELDLVRAELAEYQLAVAGEVRLVRGATDVGCGAAFQLSIANGAVETSGESLQSRCDAAREGSDLEWLGVRVANLRLERLAYQSGQGFDFLLRLDLEPRVSAVAGFTLPTLAGVTVGTEGLAIPAMDVDRAGARVDLSGFGFRVTRYRLPAFTLAWSDWQAGSPGGFRFGFDAELTLPDLAPAPASCRTGQPITLSGAELAAGRLSAVVTERAFDPGCGLTFAPDLRLEVNRVGGAFAVRFTPEIALEQSPEIEGSLVLPRLFACSDSTARRLGLAGARLRVGSGGRITGTVTGLAPACPMDLAAAQVTVSRATLVFGDEGGNQSVHLSGDAEAVLKLAAAPTRGTGSAAVDVLNGRLLSGRLDFPGPFRLDLPREKPVLSFEIAQAVLDTLGLHVNGRNRLLFADGQFINTTFNQLTIQPADLAITAGQVLFDAPFGLEVGVELGGDLSWRAVPRGQPLTVSAGVRADLPTEMALGPSGFASSGNGRARLVYGGRDLDELTVEFSRDFTIGLDPAGVRNGQADFFLDGDRVAFVNQAGFQPDLDFFADALIPAQLPLPTIAVAFATLRNDAGELLVRAENTDAGVRVFTPSGNSVALVVPALQRGDATPPSLQASFDVTLDPLGREVSAGTIRVAIPPDQQADFGLSAGGPQVVRVTDLEYSADGGLTLGGELVLQGGTPARLTGRAQVTAIGIFGTLTAEAAAGTTLLTLGDDPVRLRVTRASLELPATDLNVVASLDLFRQELGCDGVSGRVTRDSLAASISCTPERPVTLIPGADRLQLQLRAINGSALVDLAAGRIVSHRLTASSELHLDAAPVAAPADSAGGGIEPARCGATFDLTVADGVVSVNPASFQARCDAAEGDAEMGWLRLRLSNLAMERLEYRPGAGFDFAFRLDIEPSVPAVPQLALPTVAGVVIGTDGLAVPEVDAPLTAGRVEVAGFGVRVTRVRLPGFTLAWSDWQARSPDGFHFALEGDITLPEFGGGAPACLGAEPITLSFAELASGRVRFGLAERTYSPACALPLAPEVAFEVERLGGTVAVQFSPEVRMEQGPEIQGALVLPSFFACPDPTAPRRLSLAGNQLQLGSSGRISGTVTGLAPPCAIDLAALQVTISNASLEFAAGADAQSVVLSGAAAANFALAGNPVRGTGQMAVDLMRGRMLSGSLKFPGPFRFDLPRERPVLSFLINEAVFDTAGLHIAGRQRLALADGQTINTTFEDVTINPLQLALTAGAVRFDAPFAFEVGIAEDGSLGWKAVPRNAAPSVETGLRINLPEQIALTPSGFTSTGDGGARLLFKGRDVDSLTARFSEDFGIALQPFEVAQGQVDFLLAGQSIGYIDRNGFRPNFAYFAEALLPARLGLPTVEVAYLQLRDESGTLQVRSENTGSGIRLSTLPGRTVPLVLPSLQLGRAAAPRLDASFDVVLDPLGQGLSAGSIGVAVPPGQKADFNLSTGGLPVRIDTVSYHKEGGAAYRFTLGGTLALFGDSAITGGAVVLTLDGTGRLTGDVSAALAQRVPLVAGDTRLALALSRVDGAFDASLVSGNLEYDLDATGAVELAVSAGERYTAQATVHLSEQGLSVTHIEARGGESPRFIDGGLVRLGLANLRVPRLEYAYQTGAWDFELLFDVHLAFPALDSLVLPPIADVALRRDGFRIPAYSVPELSADSFPLAGFTVRPLAFRMAPFGYNWFTGETSSSPGFAFDLELGFPQDAPAELRGTRLSVLNAGYDRGGFTGTVEPRDLATPISLPLGGDRLALLVRTLGGGLTRDSARQQVVNITAGGSLELPGFARCEAGPQGDLPLPGAVITLSSAGRVSGTASQVLPRCPVKLGPLAFQVVSSDLRFNIGADAAQQVELFMRANLRLPASAAADTVTATGDIGLDLVTGRVTRGSVEVNSPFRWNLPWSGQLADGVPLFSFIVRQARVDQQGLHLTGSGQAEFYDWDIVDVGNLGQAGALAEGTAEVTFEDLTLGLPGFSITAGSVGFTHSFALDAGFEQSKPKWRSADPSKPKKDGPGVRVTLPANVSLSRDGLSIGGTAIAEVTFGDTTLAELRVAFADDFLFGYDPVGVARGRATFLLQNTEVAYVDPTGFWPGDIFGILPVPARVGLPSETIAYLQLRDQGGQLLVESRTRDNGVSLRTRNGQSVRLVIPALAGAQGETTSVNVQFDVLVNPATYQLVSGNVRATAPEGGAPLFQLDHLGLPLQVREVAYQPAETGYALRLDARLSLPAALGGVDVVFDDLLVSENGISGSAEVGRYTDHLDADVAPVASKQLAENVILDILGARATFGDSTDVSLSGVIRTPLFSPPQGGPVAIFFAGDLGPSGLALTVDPLSLPEGRLPIGLVTFEPQAVGNEPPMRITATDAEFAVRLSGVLRAPTLSDGFAATIQGLEVGTRGIVLPAISLTEPEEQQAFELFGARFTLKDSTGVYPAIALGYTGGVFAITMSGEVDFLDNLTRFYGLRVASDGGVSLAAANLLSEPVVVAENVLTLDSLMVRDGRLRADLGVTLPAPLADGGTQHVFFSVGPDGSVEGGGTVVVKDEPAGLGGERTQFNVGLATMHPRYVGVTLDLAAVERSAVQVVADVYLQHSEDNRIKVGDVAGGTVSPGLRVGFDGSVEWGNVALAREFAFDFEAVRLTLTQVSAATNGNRLSVGLSGQLALNIAAVSGSLDFTDFRIDDRGQMEFSPAGVKGGEFSIAGVVNLQVEGFAYSNTATTIEVAGGSMPSASSPGAAGVESVNVSSYIRFGGKIDIVDVLAGGVEEFLVYRTAADGRTAMIVRRATLDVYDVVSMQADLRYREIAGGFEMVLGAQGKLLQQYDVTLVGAIEQGNGTNRFGMFLSTGVTIPIPAVPVVVISELGGGFFYNPKPEYLDLVRQYAGVSQTAGEKIEAPVGRFAGLLYGAAKITPAGVAEGRVLLTVMPTALQIDGAVTILSQGNRLHGDAHLIMGLKKAYAEGNIAFTVDYDPVLNGAGQMQFYVYGPEVWGITGATEATVVNYFEGASELFIGPPGFIVSVAVEQNFDIWILEINSDFGITAWYQRSASEWGAHASIRVKAELLDGTISASGTLQSALLFPGGGTPLIYAAGKVEGCVVGQCADKRVWVKFKDGKVDDYGTGRNSELEDLLDEAQDVAEEILAAQEEAQEAAEQAQVTALAITYEELVAAYRRIQGWSEQQFNSVAQQSTGIESQYAPQPGQDAQFGWYLGLLHQDGAPSDTSLIRQYADSVGAKLAAIEQRRAAVNSRLAEISAGFQAVEQTADVPLPGNPVSQMSFAAPVTRIQVDAAGDTAKVLESGPGFAVDAEAAGEVRSALDEWRMAAERADQQTRAQLQEMENTLQEMRAVTTGADEASLLSYARLHAEAVSAAERQYAAQADHLLRKQDWMRARLAEQGPPVFEEDKLKAAPVTALAGPAPATSLSQISQVYALVNHYTAMRSIILNKTKALRAESFNRLRALIIYREALLDYWLGTNGAQLAAFVALEPGDSTAPFYDEMADSTGMWIWYHLARAGMEDANREADGALAGLVNTSAERLGGIRGKHAALSASLDRLYQSQAALTGVLHDVYDQYLLWRTEAAGDSAGMVGPDLSPFLARKAELAQELTVPRLTGVQVSSLNAGYRATQTFQWTGTHPLGTYEFLFRDAAQAEVGLGTALYSNGPAGSLTGHRFLPQRGWTEPGRSLEVGVRGGAGFVGLGRADYAVTFQEQGGGTGSSMTYVALTDVTPPSTPVVEFAGSPARPVGNGSFEAWTSRGDEVTVRWSAGDPESGIAEYLYAVGATPGDTTIRGWRTAGGRPEIRLDVSVSALTPIFVSVRARNGQNLWGGVGVSPGLRLDPSPPAFPAGAAIAAGAMADGSASPVRTVTLAACPVPEPAFPAARESSFTDRTTSTSDTWDGTLSRGTLDPALGTKSSTTSGPAPRVTPRRSFTWPAAGDSESGLFAYYWRVDTIPATAFTETGWTAAPGTQTAITVTGDPLDYQRPFHLSLVAVNYAGLATVPLSFGPFEIPDPTRPSNPAFCAGLGSSADRLVLQVTAAARDPETRVRGYRYRVRTATETVRSWGADSLDWTELVPDVAVATDPVTLTDGRSYLVDVQAMNGHGQYGDTVTSGAVYVDASPPPMPTVAAQVNTANLSVLPLLISGAADPQSGFMTQHLAVGTTDRGADVVTWRNVPGAVPGEYTVQIPLETPLVRGSTYWVRIRTVNLAGLASPIYVTSFTVPATSPIRTREDE